jgi:uncharacterized membrane protein YccC
VSTAQDAITAILGSTVIAGAVREAWLYLKARATASAEAAKVDADRKADAARTAAEDDRTAQTQLVAFMREQNAASERRGDAAAERAVTLARALQDSASSTSALAHEVARIPDAMDALARRVESLERAVMDRDRPSTPVDPPRLPPGGIS